MKLEAKILIVDDEPHIRRILQFLLEKEGYQVSLAEDGEQGLSFLQKEKPDLVLLDVMMPKLDGFTVLQRIRDNFETNGLPVIMLTAKGESSERVRGLRRGANDYLTKPFNHEELLLRIQNMLVAARAQRDANPLTGLPGNRAIEREFESRVEAGQPFAFMYIDIDHFKAFNDYYGYSRGDQAITYVSEVLCRSSQAHGASGNFIGHVGGDDFVVVSDSEHAEALANQIITAFDKGVGNLHDPEDRERGYLVVKTRAGIMDKVPLITLTVALVVCAQGRFARMAELSDVLAELKRYGKSQAGSVVARERRTPEEASDLTSSPQTINKSA
jgi:PleD family two-component response regulator